MSPRTLSVTAAVLFTLVQICATATFAQSTTEVTSQLIDSRISALNNAGNADPEVLTTYEQARTFLFQAATNADDAESYLQALTTAPAEQEAIQRRLDKLEDGYDPAAQLSGFSPEELNARLALARTEQIELTSQLAVMDRDLAARESTTATLQARMSAIDKRLTELPSIGLAIDVTAPPSLAEAQRFRSAAEVKALRSERTELESALASQPVRFGAMAAKRAEMAIQLERMQALIGELESRVSSRVDDATTLTELDIDTDDPAYQIAINLTQQDSQLREERITINDRLQQVREQVQRIDEMSRAVDERFATARRVVEFATGSDALGRVLLTYWAEVEDFKLSDPSKQLSQQAGDIVIDQISHEESLSKLTSASTFINAELRRAGFDPEQVPSSTRSKLLDLTAGYRERLRRTIATESEYLDAMTKLRSDHNALTTKVAAYQTYLEGMLMWLPNHPPLWTLKPSAVTADINYISRKIDAITFSPGILLGLASLLSLLLFLSDKRLVALQQRVNEKIARPRDDSIRYTLKALMFSMLRASPVPVLLLGIATGFDPLTSPENALINPLMNTFPFVLFAFGLMRRVCEPAGIGRMHFNWPKPTMDRIHGELRLLTRWWLPLLFLTALAHRLTPVSGDEAIGRLMILLVLLVLGYHISINQARELRAAGASWFDSTLNRLRMLLTIIILIAIAFIIQGLAFSVVVIIGILINTLWIGTGLLLTHALLIRWLRVARRHLRLEELLAQRKQQPGEEPASIEEKVPDLGDISEDTQELITSASVAVGAFALYYVWSPLLPVLDGLSRITLWTSSSEVDGQVIVNQISITTVLVVITLAAFTLFAAKRLPALVEMILRSRTSITPGARYTASTLLNYAIIAIGTVAGLSALGLQWSQLQWLVAALGVGIGFGLQEIVANFISGLIILFERPVRVGDIITIGDKDGVVTKIRIRATTIQDWDGKELLVPNKEFITGRLLNWTLSDSHTRLVIPVGIAYGSDAEAALNLLKEVITAHPLVLKDPPPSIIFTEFGDNALNLNARFFINRVEDRMPTLSALHVAINKAFNDAGIVIAFPQRDIHFDADRPLRIALEPATPAESDKTADK